MESEEFYLKIEKFLDGKLSETETSSFQDQIASDENLAKEVAVHQLERKMMGQMLDDHIETRMADWQQEKDAAQEGQKERNPENPVKKHRGKFWLWLLLPVLAVSIWWMTLPDDQASPSESTEAVQKDRTEKQQTGENPVETEKSQKPEDKTKIPEDKSSTNPGQGAPVNKNEPSKPIANIPYDQEELLAFVEEFEVAPLLIPAGARSGVDSFYEAFDAEEAGREEEAIELYLGLTKDTTDLALDAHNNLAWIYYQGRDYKPAAIHFAKVADDNAHVFQETNQWMLVLSYLADGQLAESMAEMNQVLDNRGHRFHENAVKLKERLKK